MNNVTRQSIWGTLYSYLGVGIGFLTTFFILTRFLSPEEIGLVSILREGGTILCSFALLGLNSSAFRYFPYFRQKKLLPQGGEKEIDNGFLLYMLLIGLLGLLLVFSIYFLAQDTIDSWLFKQEEDLIIHAPLLVPVTLAMTLWTILEIYLGQWMKVAFPRMIREVVLRLFFLAICLLYGMGMIGFKSFLIGFVSIYFFCLFFLFLYQQARYPIESPRPLSEIDKSIRKSFVTYTLFYLAGSLGTKLASRMDIFMVSSIDTSGFTSGGIYTIAFYIAAIVEMPFRSILPSTTPKIAKAMKENNFPLANRLYKQVALYQILSGGFIFILIWTNISDLYLIIPQGGLYQKGMYVVLFLGLSKLLDAIFTPGNTIISCSRYYRWNLYYTLSVTIIGVYINYLLIPVYGLMGAAIGTFTTQLLCYAFQQGAIRYKMQMSPFSKDIMRVIALLLLLFLLGILLPSLNMSGWVNIFYRSTILIVVALVVLTKTAIAPELQDYFTRTLDKLR